MIRKIVAAAALAVLPLVASATSAHALFSEPMPVGNWTLSNSTVGPAVADHAITLNITTTAKGDIALSGYTGCNQYNATATRAGEVMMKISTFSMTRRGCHGTSAAAAESAFVKAFSGKTIGFSPAYSTTTFVVDEHDWTFDRAAATAAVPSEIQGTWRMFNASEAKLRGGDVTMKIEADGSFSATAGCNSLFGTLRSDSSVMRVGRVGSTMMHCGDDTMSHEHAFSTSLRGVTHVSAVANRLYLSGYGGEMSFTRQK